MDALDAWILKNTKTLNLRLVEYSWPSSWWPGLFDFSCTLQLDEEFVGRGSDFDQNIAIKKAIVEALERKVGRYDGQYSSNGLAAHPDLVQAQQSALAELLERDAFLSHFLTTTPFRTVLASEIGKDLVPTTVMQKLKSLGVEIATCAMLEEQKHQGVLVVAFGLNCAQPWGMCLGTAVAPNLNQAYQKAFIECLRHVVSLVQSDIPASITVEKFLKLEKPSVGEHFQLGLDLDYARWFRGTFLETPSSARFASVAASAVKISFKELSPPPELLDLPLKAVAALSEDVQTLFFGSAAQAKINFARLQAFKKARHENFAREQINLVPHPLC